MTAEKAVRRRGRGAAEETFGAPAQRVGGAWDRETPRSHLAPISPSILFLLHQRDESPGSGTTFSPARPIIARNRAYSNS